ncbi:hypothetical protein VTJ04DRAFT_1796 [Mycothermus thermophilus]|uniref:uncharacterized protein n=1 Tax=Humicola insolens TaxID=85995 RepID=UPI0037435D80
MPGNHERNNSIKAIVQPTLEAAGAPSATQTSDENSIEADAADNQENVSSDETTAARSLYTTNFAPASWLKRKFARTRDDWTSSLGTEKGEIIVDGANLCYGM